jgi:hypothetical protein
MLRSLVAMVISPSWVAALGTERALHADGRTRNRPACHKPVAVRITGSEDHLMPPSVQPSNAKHYKSNTITEVHDFEGRPHWACGAPGWEAVADYALEWAAEHARSGSLVGAAAATIDD